MRGNVVLSFEPERPFTKRLRGSFFRALVDVDECGHHDQPPTLPARWIIAGHLSAQRRAKAFFNLALGAATHCMACKLSCVSARSRIPVQIP
jgi:hypothetical protein